MTPRAPLQPQLHERESLMMGSWRYHPASDGGQRRPRQPLSGGLASVPLTSEASLCPLCGQRSLDTQGPVKGDRMYNYYTKFPRVGFEAARSRSRPEEDRHARLSRTSDVTRLWSSEVISQPLRRSDQRQLYDDTYR